MKFLRNFFNTLLVELKFGETQIWRKYSIFFDSFQGHQICCIRVALRKSALTLSHFTHMWNAVVEMLIPVTQMVLPQTDLSPIPASEYLTISPPGGAVLMLSMDSLLSRFFFVYIRIVVKNISSLTSSILRFSFITVFIRHFWFLINGGMPLEHRQWHQTLEKTG